MSPEEFSTAIFDRWPYRGQRTEEELIAISADIASFSLPRTSEVLEPILEEFIAMKPPKGFGMWWFYERVNKKKSGKLFWRTCENGHLYENKGSSCPVCGSYSFSLTTGKTLPSETVEIQESCCACPWYKQNMTEPVEGLDGYNCRFYGTEETGTLIECNQCKCIKCCKIAHVYKENPTQYRNMMGDNLKKKYEEHGLNWAMKESGKMDKSGKS